MAVRNVEAELARLSTVQDAATLRKALSDRVNVVVAKAARIAAERQMGDLIPDLVRAFERLFEKPVERDPQCWAKNAIAQALADLEYRQAAPFLRGIGHIQMEPVWGGQSDTGHTLRGICVLALTDCRDAPREKILRRLVDAFADGAEQVRIEAARALAHMDGEEGVLLLRLKARMGDSEPGVIGQVLDSLLYLERAEGLAFVAEFLESADDAVREQAALAMGASRMPEAIGLLRSAWTEAKDDVLLRAISVSRLDEAIAFLVELVRDGRIKDASAAIEALELHRDSEEIRKQVKTAAEAREPEIVELFRARFE